MCGACVCVWCTVCGACGVLCVNLLHGHLDGSLVDGFLVPEPDERLIFRGHSVLAELSVFVVLAVAFDFLQLVKAWRGGATARHRVNGELIPWLSSGLG